MTQMSIPQAMELAMRHHRAGNAFQAESIYRQILAADPNQTDAMHLLGLVALGRGEFQAALELVDSAIAGYADEPAYHYSRGQVLAAKKERSRAIESYRRAIALRSGFVEAMANLATLLAEEKRFSEAIDVLCQSVAFRPDSADLRNNLNAVLLSLAWQGSGDPGIAIECFEKAITRCPPWPELRANLGTLMLNVGRIPDAIGHFRHVLTHSPNDAVVHYDLGKALLLSGDYQHGWREFEWRWKVPELQSRRPPIQTPCWDGIASLKDRDILLWPEQGMGDTIQFFRYVPLLAKRARRVILMCQPPLVGLLRGLEGASEVHAVGQATPRHDLYFPLMSLPSVFGPAGITEPFPLPSQLQPEARRVEYWRSRLGEEGGRIKAGIVWAGNPQKRDDHKRSIDPKALSSLGSVPDVRFISLQKGIPEAARPLPASSEFQLTDFTTELTDFTETAALITNLDVVISVDTAVAHLAGTLGKPVWILLPSPPDWRWGLDRDDSPWYPTARLFRQPVAGDWLTPIEKIKQALSRL